MPADHVSEVTGFMAMVVNEFSLTSTRRKLNRSVLNSSSSVSMRKSIQQNHGGAGACGAANRAALTAQ